MMSLTQQEKLKMLNVVRSGQSLAAEQHDFIQLHKLFARNLNQVQNTSPIDLSLSQKHFSFGDNLHSNLTSQNYNSYLNKSALLSPPRTSPYTRSEYDSFPGYGSARSHETSYECLTPSPSATQSHSRSTLLSGSSHAADYGEFSQFTARDYELLKEYDIHERFNVEDEATREEYDLLRREARLTKTHRYPNIEEESIYTAEMVHHLVKSNRDIQRKRIVSNKVFVGGISNTMHRATINNFFAQFGCVFVDWPIKVPKQNSRIKNQVISSYSYLFLVYVEEESVLKLTKQCHNPSYNEFFVKVPGYEDNMIQIRPWYLENAFYIHPDAENKKVVDIHRTVFVGGLPRIVTAEEIARMFSEFGKVLLVTIDIDQDYGYPKGAARVTFEKDSSFSMALEKKYLKFDNIDSSKTTIEIKPYVMEDVGCDQCGGLWFNPFLDILTNMTNCLEKRKTKCEDMDRKSFDMWSFNNPFSQKNESTLGLENLKIDSGSSEENSNMAEYEASNQILDQESRALYFGSLEFLKMAKSFNLHKLKKINLAGSEIAIGPDLWNLFVPQPYLGVSNEMAHLQIDQQIKSHLKLKRGNVYSNKSSYCKDKPCRQYYCSSCSHKLHSFRGPSQHNLLPAGKPERRPRKDKNMYLVRHE